MLPFVSEFVANSFEERSCFTTKEPIGGGYKGCKVASLLEAGLEVVFLLSRFFGTKDSLGVFGVVGLGIKVNDGDINETVGGRSVEVAEKEISPVLFAPVGVSGRGVGWAIGRCSRRCWGGRRKDHGLSGDTVVGSGLSIKGAYFTSKFIVASMDEATYWAGHGVVDGEGFIAAITSGGKV